MFNQIHKALRVWMYDTATLINQTDFDNPEQTSVATERLHQLLDMFDNHADHEDTLVFPLLQPYEPSVVEALEQEHVTDHALVQRLKGFLLALDHAVSTEAKTELGHSLNTAFIDFMVFNLQHMKKEETVINNLLWRYYSDPDLVAVSQKIVASIPPAESAIASRWMFKALSNHEISGWLRTVERNAPNHVFRPLLTLAEKELDPERFRYIQEEISEGALITS